MTFPHTLANCYSNQIIKSLLLYNILFFTLANGIQAQTTFQKIYSVVNSEECYSVQLTAEGGYIMAGTTTVPGNLRDMYLLKTDVAGETVWAATFGGTNLDYGISAQQTSDGGYIVVGQTRLEDAGDIDILVVKTDASGTLLWSKNYGNFGSDKAAGIKQTTDGGYIIYGSYHYSSRAYLIKTDENGNIIWTKTYTGKVYATASYADQTSDGGYFLMGRIVDSLSDYIYNVMLIKTDANGDTLWTNTFGSEEEDEPHSAKQTSDGGFIVTGRTYSLGAGSTDIFLTKTDAYGTVLWTKTYGGPLTEIAFDVMQTTDGGYIVSGWTTSFGNGEIDMYLIRANADGDTLWTRTYGGEHNDIAHSVKQTPDGGFVVAGNTRSYGEQDDIRFYFIKTDTNGNSGCNEKTPPTIVTSLLMQNTKLQILINTGGTMASPETMSEDIETSTTTRCSTVWIDEKTLFPVSITIFPNPFSSSTTLEFSKYLNNATLTIYSITGKQLKKTENISGQKIMLNREKLQAGIYFIQLTEDSKSIAIGKLIVSD